MAWVDRRYGSPYYSIYAQRLEADGTLAGDEIRIIGRVVRVQPGRGVGVEINSSLLSQYARLALEDFLRSPEASQP